MKIVLIIIIFLIHTVSFAESSIKTIPLVAYWQVGDTFNYKVTKTKEKKSGSKQTKKTEYQYIAKFEVIAATNSSYTIKWTLQNEWLKRGALPDNLVDGLKDWVKKYRFQEVIYTTSETGEFKEIKNWQALSKAMQEMIDEFYSAYEKKSPKQPKSKRLQKNKQIYKLTAMLNELYSSKKGIEEIVFKEIAFMHSAMGKKYRTTDFITEEIEAPSILGNIPIKSTIKLYVQEIDPEQDTVTLKMEQRILPEETNKLLALLLEKTTPDNQNLKALINKSDLVVNDDEIHIYNYHYGLPLDVSVKRHSKITLGGQVNESIDTLRIELVEDELLPLR